MMMDRRLSRESSKGSTTLQKKVVESRRQFKSEHAPDLTDFMNDMFFGTVNNDKKAYNLTGKAFEDEEEASFDDSTRSNSSRLTQEWLEEAKRMMASSPTRGDSPSRLVGSPKFASGAVPSRLASGPVFDRRDPLSRSARRNRPVEGFGEEILIKSAKHSRTKSESLINMPMSPTEPSHASQVPQSFSNVLKPSYTNPNINQSDDSTVPITDTTDSAVPPRQSTYRKSRFQTEAPLQGIPVPSRRTFKTAPFTDTLLLSPPKNLIESVHRRSISSSTCAQLENEPLSPPRNLVESVHKRSIAKSTCSIKERNAQKPNFMINGQKEEDQSERDMGLNGFLKKQRNMVEKILNGETDSKAKVILSGPSNCTSSMAAAICYAWLLEKRMMKNEGEGHVVVPVMNVRRGRMWKQRQVAWLFHHAGLDTTSLLFADEVDLESLIMAGKLTILVVGQDILKTDTQDGSQCTILTDNYCEDAYDLLQTPLVKKLLLAGILLDTQNLNASAKLSMTRDAEAVQLLLVGSAPNYSNTLFEQLMQEQRDSSFFEALRYNYGKPPSESGLDSIAQMGYRGSERKSTSTSQNQTIIQNSDMKPKDVKTGKPNKDKPNTKPAAAAAAAAAQAAPDNSRGKSKFFLAKWFGFGK